MIVATDAKYGIAKEYAIPWRIPADLRFFQKTTTDHTIFMGKNTFCSLPNKTPLKDRFNIVYTRYPMIYDEFAAKYDNLSFTNDDRVLTSFPPPQGNTIFIIGGKMIYEKYYPVCDTLWFTKIKKDYDCDMFLDMDMILAEFTEPVEIIEDTVEYTIYKYRRGGASPRTKN